MVNAKIEGDTATLELRIQVPKHYYEFLEYLEEDFGYDTTEITRMAANGIIGELNTIHEELTGAITKTGCEVHPDLSVGTMKFKTRQKPVEGVER